MFMEEIFTSFVIRFFQRFQIPYNFFFFGRTSDRITICRLNSLLKRKKANTFGDLV